MDQPREQQANKSYIFVDTCVIQFAGNSNESLSESVIDCLSTLAKDNYRLAISEITLFENLHGLWGTKAAKAAALLRTYERKIVSGDVLALASVLGGLYNQEKLDGIEVGDKIIAATCVLENGLVLTTNHKDYPHPFFITEKEFPLVYKTGHYTRTLDVTLYRPNIKLIVRRINENERLG